MLILAPNAGWFRGVSSWKQLIMVERFLQDLRVLGGIDSWHFCIIYNGIKRRESFVFGVCTILSYHQRSIFRQESKYWITGIFYESYKKVNGRMPVVYPIRCRGNVVPVVLSASPWRPQLVAWLSEVVVTSSLRTRTARPRHLLLKPARWSPRIASLSTPVAGLRSTVST